MTINTRLYSFTLKHFSYTFSDDEYSTENMSIDSKDANSTIYKKEEIRILRFLKVNNKYNKFKKKTGEKIVKDSDNEEFMKLVAEEILNQHPKSEDTSSVYVVIDSDCDSNITECSSTSIKMKNNRTRQKSQEKYPIVTSSHQLELAARGVKFLSMPRDMKDILEEEYEKRATKNKRQANEQDGHTQTKNKRRLLNKLFCSKHCLKIAESFKNSEKNVIPRKQACTVHHKHKHDYIKKEQEEKNNIEREHKERMSVYQKPSKGIGLNIRPIIDTQIANVGRKEKPVEMEHRTTLPKKTISKEFEHNTFHQGVNTRTIHERKHHHGINIKGKELRQTAVHQVETTQSLTRMFQTAKSIGVAPHIARKGFDTTCDRPCSCEDERKQADIPETLNQMLSPPTFESDLIPLHVTANKPINSQNASPFDTEPCRCLRKDEPQDQLQPKIKHPFPPTEILLEYGVKQNKVSVFISPPKETPCQNCKCRNRFKKRQKSPKVKHNETSRRCEICEQQKKLKCIKEQLNNRCNQQKQKHIEVIAETNYRPPPQFMNEQDSCCNIVVMKHASACPDYFRRDDEQQTYDIKNDDEEEINTRQVDEQESNLILSVVGNTDSFYEMNEHSYEKCSCQMNSNNMYDENLTSEMNYDLPYDEEYSQTNNQTFILEDDYDVPVSYYDNNQEPNYSDLESNFLARTRQFEESMEKPEYDSNLTSRRLSNECPKCLKLMTQINVPEENSLNCGSSANYENSVNYENSKHYENSDYYESSANYKNYDYVYGQTYEGNRSVQISRIALVTKPKEAPCASLPKPRPTFDSDRVKIQNNREAMCNHQKECCHRGTVIDSLNPAAPCDEFQRFAQIAPTQGFKFTTLGRVQRDVGDLLIYEDSSCCCIDKKAGDDEWEEDNNCIGYCSGSTVEDIRDAVLRFMRAKEEGKICSSIGSNSRNVCDETRELFQGIDEGIAECEQYNDTNKKADDSSYANNKFKCCCPTNVSGDINNCMCETNNLGLKPPPNCSKSAQKDDKIRRAQTLTPKLKIQRVGLRERAEKGYAKDPTTCECRTPKGKAPRDKCICPPKENCECPSATEDDWIDYFCSTFKSSRRAKIKCQTELSQKSSGFKFRKKRRDCNKINTHEAALDYYNDHIGLEKEDETGKIMANKDGNCPGCGVKNCPGLWDPNFFDPKTFDPAKLVEKNLQNLENIPERYAKDTEIKPCKFSSCADAVCTGTGPYGKLPPIPGGPVSSVKVTDPEERGPHKACSCESREDFENAIYYKPTGPALCECNAANVSCECSTKEKRAQQGGKKEVEFPSSEANDEGKGLLKDQTKIGECQALRRTKIDEVDSLQIRVAPFDTDPCAPVGGFKISLGGKRTASEGLTGIGCFTAMEGSSSSEESTYVVYY